MRHARGGARGTGAHCGAGASASMALPCWLPLLLAALLVDLALASPESWAASAALQVGPSLDEEPLRVHLLRISARYNFRVLKNKWWPPKPITVRTSYHVPSSWSSNARKAARNMARAAAALQEGQGSGEFEIQLAAYPRGHIFRQHAAEYYLTLSLLTGLPRVKVVADPHEAEVIFVPFFSSVSYHSSHRHRTVCKSLVQELINSHLWTLHNGTDHVVPGVHPLALSRIWGLLPTARFLSVDFSCPPESVAYIAKDVPVPYASAFTPVNDGDEGTHSHGWLHRPHLLFFRGNVDRKMNGAFVRKGLAKELSKQPGVVFEKGRLKWSTNVTGSAEFLMQRTKFCLAPEGDTTSSCRLFDGILAGCVPVVVSDDIEPPFEEFIDYTQFTLFVPTLLALRKGYLMGLLTSVSEDDWTRMHQHLLKVQKYFLFSTPAEPGGAEEMIWRSIGARVRRSLKWKNKRRRLAKMAEQLTNNGLSMASWVARPRALV